MEEPLLFLLRRKWRKNDSSQCSVLSELYKNIHIVFQTVNIVFGLTTKEHRDQIVTNKTRRLILLFLRFPFLHNGCVFVLLDGFWSLDFCAIGVELSYCPV